MQNTINICSVVQVGAERGSDGRLFVRSGTMAMFYCTGFGDPGFNITWTLNGDAFSWGLTDRRSNGSLGETVKSVVLIETADENFRGEYKCLHSSSSDKRVISDAIIVDVFGWLIDMFIIVFSDSSCIIFYI